VSRAASLTSALRLALETPSLWALALGAFLIRGGIVLLALPIVVLPTPVGLGNAFGPTLTSVAFGSVPGEVLVAFGALIVGTLLWLLAGGWLAAALEGEAIRTVALDSVLHAAADRPIAPTSGLIAARILAARLIALIPLGLVLAWGSVRLVVVAYRELTSPLDVSTPIVVRVLGGAPEVVFGIVLAWMIGEVVGAVAARRIVLRGDGVVAALRFALVSCARRPVSTLARFWIPTFGLVVVVLVPSALAAGSAGGAVRSVLGEPSGPIRVLFVVVALVMLWMVGLVLVSVVCAWRSAVWTVAGVTREGTFGGSPDRRPGDWRDTSSSGTL